MRGVAMMQAYRRAPRRADVPCDSDAHMFHPEAYEFAAVNSRELHDERCTLCGWTWDEIADHDQGECCCPGNHSSKPPRDL